MQAIMATLKALPAAMSRSPNGWMTGLQRMAEIVAMYRPIRTAARPPKMVRWARMVPESRFMGATPTRAAICWRLSSDSVAPLKLLALGDLPPGAHATWLLADALLGLLKHFPIQCTGKTRDPVAEPLDRCAFRR
jgi:hypothetical protein